jgi:hypothetical protein
MNNEPRDKSVKRRSFPTIPGIFVGLITGAVALFNEFSEPFWITFNAVLIVVAFGFAAANLVGLVVLKYRRSSGAEKSSL